MTLSNLTDSDDLLNIDDVKISDEENPEKSFVTIGAIPVHLLDDCVRIETSKDTYKFVKYPDFLQFLNLLLKDLGRQVDDEALDQLWLPSNCFYLERNAFKIRISMYYPECKQPVQHLAKKYTCIIPNIIINHELEKSQDKDTYRVINTWYFATNKSIQELTRKFYNKPEKIFATSTLPFNNCYSSGMLCYGSNVRVSTVKLPDLKPLHWYYDMLFSTPFNNDLSISAIKPNSKFYNQYAAWYDHLHKLATENKPFPYNELTAFT